MYHVQQIFKMSGEELLLNSIKCPAKNSKCPVKPKKFLHVLPEEMDNVDNRPRRKGSL